MAASSSDNAPQFIIRMTVDNPSSVSREEITRVAEYLGGTATEVGFAFPTDQRRAAALEALAERFGPKCFALEEPSWRDGRT